MPFEMESSFTANTAKLAVLWRDRQAVLSGGVPDRFVREIFGDALLAKPAAPTPTPPTEAPGSSSSPAPLPPSEALVNRETVFTASTTLKNMYALLVDLRGSIVGPGVPGAPGALEPLTQWPDPTVVPGGSVYTALAALQAAISSFEQAMLELRGQIPTRRDIQEVVDGLLSQIKGDIERLQKGVISAENRIRNLEENYTSLSQRVGMLESGTSGQ